VDLNHWSATLPTRVGNHQFNLITSWLENQRKLSSICYQPSILWFQIMCQLVYNLNFN